MHTSLTALVFISLSLQQSLATDQIPTPVLTLSQCRDVIVEPNPQLSDLSTDKLLRRASLSFSLQTVERTNQAKRFSRIVIIAGPLDRAHDPESGFVLDEMINRFKKRIVQVVLPWSSVRLRATNAQIEEVREKWFAGESIDHERERALIQYFEQLAEIPETAAQAALITRTPGEGVRVAGFALSDRIAKRKERFVDIKIPFTMGVVGMALPLQDFASGTESFWTPIGMTAASACALLSTFVIVADHLIDRDIHASQLKSIARLIRQRETDPRPLPPDDTLLVVLANASGPARLKNLLERRSRIAP